MLRTLLVLGCIMATASNIGFSRIVGQSTIEFRRHSEGSMIELRDGTLLLAWSRFTGGGADHSTAHIAAMTSKDGGKTWTDPYVIQETTGKQNVMSVSFLRLKDGRISMWYLEKNSNTDLQVYVRYSSDEAKTWTPPQRVTPGEGYHIMNNDRVIQTSTGRIICPICYSADIGKRGPLYVFCMYSDDEGKTWHRSMPELHAPMAGAMEPGVVELANGDVLMFIRTQTGCQYRSVSKNKGMTWSEPVPSKIKSPDAPMTVKRIPKSKDLLMVWDNNYEAGHPGRGERIPLAAAISHDNGKTWEHTKNVDAVPGHRYAYTSALFVKDQVLLTYYDEIPGTPGWSLRLRSIPLTWFYSD